MFLGRLRMDLIDPYPADPAEDLPEFHEFLGKLRRVLAEKADGARHDREETIPDDLLDALRGISAFAIKMPKEYGGLGLPQSAYNRAMEMVERLAYYGVRAVATLYATRPESDGGVGVC